MVRFFVAQDPGCVEGADGDGSLPLHVALSKKGGKVDLELVQVLVEARPLTLLTADAKTGSLPLHVALQQPEVDLEIVKYLVEQQPRALQHKNSGGLLPMHVAAAAAAAAAAVSAAVSAAVTGNNDAAATPPDVVFYLASKWPQAVFGETGAGSAAGVVVGDGDGATPPEQPRQRRPKRAKQS
jgi:ankyrin repeat protein